MIKQIVEVIVVVAVLGSGIWVILPSDNCDRVNRASMLTYVPFSATAAGLQSTGVTDANFLWEVSESLKQKSFDWLASFFGMKEQCTQYGPSVEFLNPPNKKQEYADKIKTIDQELYQKLERK